jgi:hypothetical protein
LQKKPHHRNPHRFESRKPVLDGANQRQARGNLGAALIGLGRGLGERNALLFPLRSRYRYADAQKEGWTHE